MENSFFARAPSNLAKSSRARQAGAKVRIDTNAVIVAGAEQTNSAVAAIQNANQLKDIRIPSISFNDTSLSEDLGFIERISAKLDTQEADAMKTESNLSLTQMLMTEKPRSR